MGRISVGNITTSRAGRVSPVGSVLDSLPTALAAYSLRRLLTAYAGSAIRVRRSSDNTEADIGFDGSGNLNTTALLAHCGAGSGFVTTWYDQSGNARNATQATAGLQPRVVNAGAVDLMGSRPAVVALGSGCCLNFTSVSARCVNAALLVASNAVSLAALISQSGSDFSIRRSITQAYGWRSDTVADFAIQSGSFVSGNAGSGTSDSNPAIQHALNSVAVLTFASGAAASLGRLFDNSWVASRSLNGSVPEVILFGALLGTTDRQNLERNQGSYYGITVA